MTKHFLLTLLACVFVTVGAHAQCTTCTESLDNTTITAGNSVACAVAGVVTTLNRYIRVYDAIACGIFGPVEVCQVSFGVEAVNSGDGISGVCAILNVYADGTLDDFPGDMTAPAPIQSAGLTLLRSEPVFIPDSASGTIVTHEFYNGPVLWDAFMPAASELVVELHFPGDAQFGGAFFIGSNTLGETSPGYLQSANCGLPSPSPVTAINPTQFMIMDIAVATPTAGGGMGCTCLGTQMEHPGTGEDLMLVSANLTTGSAMTTGHGGATEKTMVAGDTIELRFGSVDGTFDFSPWFILGTLHAPGTVPVVFGGLTGHDIYADTVSAVPNATVIAWGTGLPNIGSPILLPGCMANRVGFVNPLPSGVEVLLQLYATTASAANSIAAASNGHDLVAM